MKKLTLIIFMVLVLSAFAYAGGINWINHQMVIDIGDEGTYDTARSHGPAVIKDGSIYKMWYSGYDGSDWFIIYCDSTDGKTWSNHQKVLEKGAEGTYDTSRGSHATIIKEGATYNMWYTGDDGSNTRIIFANSTDGENWANHQLVIDIGDEGTYDTSKSYAPSVIKDGATYEMWYTGQSPGSGSRIIFANSTDGINWNNHQMVVDIGEEGTYDTDFVQYSTIVKDNGEYNMWYSGYDGSAIRIVYCNSSDGITWSNHQLSVDTSAEGTYDTTHSYTPSVLTDNSVHKMWYSGYSDTNRIIYAEEDPCPSGMVSYWTFDDEDLSGSTVTDTYGNNDGTNNGATTGQTGKVGEAFSFDGSDDYVDIGEILGYGATDAHTITAWINVPNPNTFQGIVGRQDNDQIPGYQLSTGGWDNEGEIFYAFVDDASESVRRRSAATIPANQWAFVGITYDGSNSLSGLHMYINGTQTDGATLGSGSMGSFTYDSNFMIGSRDASSAFLNGKIDDVAIFNKVLSSSEITDLYNKGVAGTGLCEVSSASTPTYNNFTSTETTNFSEADDITNVTNVTLAVTGKGKIKFPESYGINAENQDFDSNIVIDDEFISVNTAALDSSFNSSATISIEGVTCPVDVITYKEGSFAAKDDILAGGSNCILDGVCSNVVCSAGTLTFDVAHFTGFAAGGNANLTIWADSGIYYENQSVGFHASYINSTDATPLSGECNISFSDAWGTWYEMDYNGSEYNYSRNFTTAGLKNYNVSCYNSSYIELEANDSKLITSLSGDVPEFSLLTLGLGLIAVLIGLVIVRKHNP